MQEDAQNQNETPFCSNHKPSLYFKVAIPTTFNSLSVRLEEVSTDAWQELSSKEEIFKAGDPDIPSL